MYMSHVYKPHYELLIMLMFNVILHYITIHNVVFKLL